MAVESVTVIDDKYRVQDDDRNTPYLYKCEKCGHEETLYFSYSMKDPLPNHYECPKCKGSKSMYRTYGQTITIPFQWGQESGIKFDKSPSRRKHYY